MTRPWLGLAAAAGFVLTVVVANILTTRYGFIPVGFGYEATAGTYAAGCAFILRDTTQDELGRLAVGVAIAVGALLSLWLAAPAIAVASGTAFAVSEACDWAVYEPLRAGGYVRAALASNVVGSVVDSIVFLAVAGFPVWSALPGQLIGKLTVTLLVVGLVVVSRALLRARVNQAGA